MKGARLWPDAIDGWKIAEGPTGYGPDTAYKYMNGAAELFIAYNMKSLAVLRYEKPARPAVTLEIYDMGSSGDAFGLFSFERDDPGAGIGQGSEFGGGLLRFWKGRYFVSVYGDGTGQDLEAATLGLGRAVAASITETGPEPSLLVLLPKEEAPYAKERAWYLHSHILLNQRFFVSNSNILMLGSKVEAALGQYGTGKERVRILMVKYPGGKEADEAFRSFRGAYMPDAGGKPAVRTENKKWTAARKDGPYVTVVFDAPDEAWALRSITNATAGLMKEAK